MEGCAASFHVESSFLVSSWMDRRGREAERVVGLLAHAHPTCYCPAQSLHSSALLIKPGHGAELGGNLLLP